MLEKVKRTGLLFNEKQIQWLFPAMKIGKTRDGMVLVKGIGQGGTTTISAGNAVRRDQDLKAIGIDLDIEFQELSQEIPITTDHQRNWHPLTREVYSICQQMSLQPEATPKMIQRKLCTGCGKCVLGCQRGSKWDSRNYLNQALEKGAELVSGWRVQRVLIEKGRAKGVVATNGFHVLPRLNHPGSRRSGNSDNPTRFRNSMPIQAVCRSGPVCGCPLGQDMAEPGDDHALHHPKGAFHHLALFRFFEFLFQSELAIPGERYFQPDD
jgi:ferredoxin